eukprot:361809-Chlamydomonas_euryale.AAC.6
MLRRGRAPVLTGVDRGTGAVPAIAPPRRPRHVHATRRVGTRSFWDDRIRTAHPSSGQPWLLRRLAGRDSALEAASGGRANAPRAGPRGWRRSAAAGKPQPAPWGARIVACVRRCGRPMGPTPACWQICSPRELRFPEGGLCPKTAATAVCRGTHHAWTLRRGCPMPWLSNHAVAFGLVARTC